MKLKIQCPKCSKRFTVNENLIGKTVECGACDHRFSVEAESIIVERKKVYPGEHRGDDFLNKLGRDQSGGGKEGRKGDFVEATPRFTPQVDSIMPSSAGQKIAFASGLGLTLLYAILFFIGSGEGGFFEDVLMEKRLILGGFVAFLGAALIIMGAKNWRIRAIFLAIFLVAGLIGLVLVRPVHHTPYADVNTLDANHSGAEVVEEILDEAEIKARVGYLGMQRKLDDMITKHGAEGEKYVVGIFIEDLSGSAFHEIEKYLLKALSIPPTEGISRYRRNGEKDSLLVISGVPMDFDTVVRRCDPRLGNATTYPEHRLIDLKLSGTLFTVPSGDQLTKLTDSEHPAFFSRNLDELKALDPVRVGDAVARLANVRPDIPRLHEDKIVPEFLRILSKEEDPKLLSDLGKALRVWASGQAACVELVAKNVKKWMADDVVVPKSLVDYLNDNDSKDAPVIVDQLWGQDPELWSKQYMALGSSMESRLIYHLEESPLKLKKAALLILNKTGTSLSLPTLERMKSSSDAEVKILAEGAIRSIKAR